MPTELIITAPPTNEYIKKYLYSERWQTIRTLTALLDYNQQNIALHTEDILDNIESSDADTIAFFLIMDPLGVGMEFSVEQIENILGELRTANANNQFFLIITAAFTDINATIKKIIEFADYVIFLNNNDYDATRNVLKAEQKFLIINPPSSLEHDDTLIDDRANNVLVNGDILYLDAVTNLCRMANILQKEDPNMEIMCYIDVPYRHEITALVWLLKAIYPKLNPLLNKKLALDPNLSARELVAWFEEQDTVLIGPQALPIALAFNKPTALQNVVSECAYAYDPVHVESSKISCRLNGFRASGLLVVAGDPLTAAHSMLNYNDNRADLIAALQQQTQEYNANYSNQKILNTILKCFDNSKINDELDILREKYPNVNYEYSYDEDFFWRIICNKAASLNLHFEDERYGGLVLSDLKTAFICDEMSFSITNPLLIGGQEAAIKLSVDSFKQAINKELSEKHSIITPLFKKGIEHWCLALIEINANIAKLTILETINNDVSLQAGKLIQSALPEKVRLIESKTKLVRSQQDDVSCGPLTIKHLFAVLLPHNEPAPKHTPYTLTEIYALRDEHLKLLDDPALIERQTTNASPAAEPQKTRIDFDLYAAVRYWGTMLAKLGDNTEELNKLFTLCQQFMQSEQPDAFDCSSAKSNIKTWFANNAKNLDCVPLFDIFFEYPKSATDNNEPRWKDNSIDNLVTLLKIVNIQYLPPTKTLRFSSKDPENSSESDTSTEKLPCYSSKHELNI